MLRLVQAGEFRAEMRRWMAQHGEPPEFSANLPGRYLKYRELRLDSSRFRTYLRGVIRNLVCEAIRAAARQPRQLDQRQWDVVEPFVEESISRSLQQSWLRQCLEEAAWQLHLLSSKARTRGRQRLFRILYLSTVAGQSTGEMAQEMGVDRTTVSGLLREARGRFAARLARIAGIHDQTELRDLLAKEPDQLSAALARVHDMTT
jgi:RNA polymerase sigma factor (sigma-70 family)